MSVGFKDFLTVGTKRQKINSDLNSLMCFMVTVTYYFAGNSTEAGNTLSFLRDKYNNVETQFLKSNGLS